MRILRAGIAAALLAVAAPVGAQDNWERFQLFTGCQPVAVAVENLPPDAADIGLTHDSLRAAVESRLRAARLYKDSLKAPRLYLSVQVLGPAFSVRMTLHKMVWEPESDITASAVTWTTTGLGTHAKNAGYIRNIVVEYLDQFLADYLRVNESACQ